MAKLSLKVGAARGRNGTEPGTTPPTVRAVTTQYAEMLISLSGETPGFPVTGTPEAVPTVQAIIID